MDDPVASVLKNEIRGFKPHLFIFIGHGDSSQKTSKARSFFLKSGSTLTK